MGCSIGALGELIKKNTSAEVTGIELNEQMGSMAKEKLDKVIIEDIESINLLHHFSSDYFDAIIFADILEHLKDPWSVLKNSTALLSGDGVVIASIPNVRHYTTIINLVLKGQWPYRERGIHDVNHLRFFTLKNIKKMFHDAGLIITRVERNYRIIERPHEWDNFSNYFALPLIKDFLTFQFIVVARKKL